MRGAGFPVKVHGRYLMSPSPIPRWDVPNLNNARCLYLFGAGREKRLYAVPPHTRVEPLEFEDVRFRVEDWGAVRCAYSGAGDAFLDEIFENDGSRKYVVNDSNFLDRLRAGTRPAQRLFRNPA
jgi:alpha-D-ribose 1-methylphosphonate 5-phosphate C-P lyase